MSYNSSYKSNSAMRLGALIHTFSTLLDDVRTSKSTAFNSCHYHIVRSGMPLNGSLSGWRLHATLWRDLPGYLGRLYYSTGILLTASLEVLELTLLQSSLSIGHAILRTISSRRYWSDQPEQTSQRVIVERVYCITYCISTLGWLLSISLQYLVWHRDSNPMLRSSANARLARPPSYWIQIMVSAASTLSL